MKYVSYYRVSTKRQGESGLGLEAQKRDIEIFMNNYSNNGELVAEFTDIESGTKDDRKEFTKALNFCKETGATMVVAKLDRLSRKVSFIASLMEQKGFQFKVAQMPLADNFQLHIYAALAEQERDFISKRTKAALKVKKDQGIKLGAAAHKEASKASNLKRQPRAAIEFANNFTKDLTIMREVGLTYSQIADKFNGRGEVTRKGSSYNAMTVQRMCKRLQIS